MIEQPEIIFVEIPKNFVGNDIYMHHNFDSIEFCYPHNWKCESKYLGTGKFNLLGDYEKLTPELKAQYDEKSKLLEPGKNYIALKTITDEEFWELLAKLQDAGTPLPKIKNIDT